MHLSDFITSERNRFEVRHNNAFAMCFSQLERYREFLGIVLGRYSSVDSALVTHMEAHRALFVGANGPMNAAQMEWLTKQRALITLVHLEIESFYQFAKILLDRTARALEFYFGHARSLSLTSFNNLEKHFRKYAVSKGLTVPSDALLECIDNLKKSIVDYRDKEITHETLTRSVFGYGFSLGKRGSSIRMRNVIYPTDRDGTQVESQPLGHLANEIDVLLDDLVTYIVLNKEKSALRIEEIPAPPVSSSVAPLVDA